MLEVIKITDSKTVELVKVVSSNIKAVGYDEETNTLFVQFNTGFYKYEQVPKAVYEALLIAESKGKFVQANIIKVYKYSKWQEPSPRMDKIDEKDRTNI